MDTPHKNALLLLRLGVAFAFLYPALSAFIEPALWIGYVPAWINLFIPREIFLLLFSTLEIIIAISVLIFNKPLPSITAGLLLLSIVVLNTNEFSIVFRDLSIATMAFALALLLKNT